MLGKLFKYEFKSTARWMLPSYILLLLMSLINMGIVLKIGGTIFGVFESLFMGTYFIAIVAVGMITLIMAAVRFYKNLLSNEGYISMTLPVSVDEHLAVKLITSTVWIIASIAVIIVSCMIVISPTGIISDIIEVWYVTIKELNVYLDGKLGIYVINIILNCLTSAVQSVLMLYFAMALGQLSNNHKVGMAIVSYISISFALQIISSMILGNMLISIVSVNTLSDGIAGISQYGVITIIWNIILSVGFYFGTRYILAKRINLQ